MAMGSCLEVAWDVGVVGAGDKGRVKEYRSCSKERFELEERGLSPFGSGMTPL